MDAVAENTRQQWLNAIQDGGDAALLAVRELQTTLWPQDAADPDADARIWTCRLILAATAYAPLNQRRFIFDTII